MTVKDDLHYLVDELDDDAGRGALAYLRTLCLPAFPTLRPTMSQGRTKTA
jgi:hypothetical protein